MKLLIAITVICAVNCANLPSGIEVCSHSAPDYKNCVTKAATGAIQILASGDKSMGLPSNDPLFIKTIHIAGNGGPVDLEQTYMDLNVHGLKDSEFEDFDYKIDDSNCDISFVTVSPKINLDGQYKVEGKLMVFSLNGFGKANITLTNLRVKQTGKCKVFEKKGKKYIKIESLDVDLQPDGFHFDIENLIDGNKQLSDEVLKVLNENPMEIFKEVKSDYDGTFAELFKQLCNIFFNKVPMEEIFID